MLNKTYFSFKIFFCFFLKTIDFFVVYFKATVAIQYTLLWAALNLVFLFIVNRWLALVLNTECRSFFQLCFLLYENFCQHSLMRGSGGIERLACQWCHHRFDFRHLALSKLVKLCENRRFNWRCAPDIHLFSVFGFLWNRLTLFP